MSSHSELQYRKAKRRVAIQKGFYWHLVSYIVIIGFLMLINQLTDPGDWWFHWPMFGWGFGLIWHYLGVFGLPGKNFTKKEWEQEAINKELQKMRPPDIITVPDEELELKEFKKLREEWDNSEFV